MIKGCKLRLGYINPVTPLFDLTIADNQWIGIIGKNGMGKSTFFKTILGILPPLHGSLSVLKAPPGAHNDFISYIPQEREINLADRMSGISLIMSSFNGWHYGLPRQSQKMRQKVKALIELVGASTYAHQPFNTLSGGQKKRIYLAQALVNKPRLLLLDEPLADLDPHAKQHFIQALQKIRAQHDLGVLIISHDMHEIANYLDAFVHFSASGVHYCANLECVKEDSYVGI